MDGYMSRVVELGKPQIFRDGNQPDSPAVEVVAVRTKAAKTQLHVRFLDQSQLAKRQKPLTRTRRRG